MAYDDTSMIGDAIAEEYLEENNPLNPESPFGYFIYRLIGGGFDKMEAMSSRFVQDCNVLSTTVGSLDDIWGLDLGIPRPYIVDDTSTERLLTDDEYRVYLYIRNSRLMTMEDIINVFTKAMGSDENPARIDKISTGYLTLTDHLHYTSSGTDTSDINKNSSDTSLDFVIDLLNDTDTVNRYRDMLHTSSSYITVISVPNNNWDSQFLALLEEWASIKGNISIVEYDI